MVDSLLDDLVGLYKIGDTINFPYLVSIGESGDLIVDKLINKLDIKYNIKQEPIRVASLHGEETKQLEKLRGKDVLICDSIVNSGSTLLNWRDEVLKFKPGCVRTLGLVVRTHSKIVPNFYTLSAGKYDDVFLGGKYYPVRHYKHGCIRELRQSDAGKCIELNDSEDFISSYLCDYLYTIEVDKFKEYGAKCLVVEDSDSDTIAGFIYFKITSNKEAFVEVLAVDKNRRNMHVASQLLNHLENYCKQNKIDRVRMFAVEDKVQVYERFEYKSTGYSISLNHRNYHEMVLAIEYH